MHIVPLPDNPEALPAAMPADTDQSSSCPIVSDGGPGLTIWSVPGVRTSTETSRQVHLRLSPDAPAIIGRQDGGEIEYLDPRYVPSPIMPGSGRTILQRDGKHEDVYVSRGHFMLRGYGGGVLFCNGVPRRGGGIRPPKNWTQLLAPEHRRRRRGEPLLLDRGDAMTIALPNGTRLTIQAG